jgi:hypothetical protein
MKRLIFLYLLFISMLPAVFSDDNAFSISIHPEMRTRMEYRDGFQKLAPRNTNPALFVSQRTRIGFDIQTSTIKLRITPQDVRVWGDEQYGSTAGITGNDASFDLFEGYAAILFGNNHWLSVGRQVIAYDNDWLLSGRNWNQHGISSDAVVAKLNYDKYAIHAGVSWNSTKESLFDNHYATNRYKTLNYLWLNKEEGNAKLSLLHVITGQTETETTNNLTIKHTTGVYYSKVNGDFSFNTNAYYQYGKNQEAKDVSAYMFYLDLAHNFSNVKILGSATYLSGNKVVGVDQEKDANFDLLYTARHKYLGMMDYYTNIGLHTKQGGLVNYALNVNYKINKKVSLHNSIHYFSLAQTNTNTLNSKSLGFENDLILKYKFNRWSLIEAGYLFYIPTESLQAIQNVHNPKFSHFAYFQLSLNFGNIVLKR